MDTFPGLVIYLSLLWLSRTTEPWESLNNGENLVFTEKDFLPPFRTQAWEEVSAIDDPHVGQLATRLQSCCEPRWSSRGPLEPLLPTVNWWEHIPDALHTPPPARTDGPRLPPPDPDWWKTSTKAAPPPPPVAPTPKPAPRPKEPFSTAARVALTMIATLFGVLIGGTAAVASSTHAAADTAFSIGALGTGLVCLVLVLYLTRRR
jgi:hypothetical protein